MQSFRTELEHSIIEQDILDLEKKIYLFKNGKIDEDKFRSLRLARGVYGQRQQGVQMVRIKIPFGRINAKQLRSIANISDKYSNGNLHITTRQDIQIHYVSLDDTPELWNELEKDSITLREACGNTVRNVTASIFAGIHPQEVFDPSVYAYGFFEYFLRNPICQDMGRKFKVAFSSSDDDEAFTFMHDLGFIPKIKEGKKGFKVMIGGGIGSQPMLAHVIYNFLEADKIIPFSEAVLRVFDRYGERINRNKARMKFLIQKIGINTFLNLVEKEKKALQYQHYDIIIKDIPLNFPKLIKKIIPDKLKPAFLNWKRVNVFYQKQKEFVSIGLKINTGDINSEKVRLLSDIIELYTGNDVRLTINQSILLRFVPIENIELIYLLLEKLDLVTVGFHRINDIVACPGTDTCNLGIASSMGLAKELEKIIYTEFLDLIEENNLSIKISGCMNACGQHTIANIGFQGMTIKFGNQIVPATQILLGGGINFYKKYRFADKVLKVPSKRVPYVLRWILNDFKYNKYLNETFNNYYDRKGEFYFYQNLKCYSDIKNLIATDFIDWGAETKYKKSIGIGECAGVIVDLVQILFFESDEKLELSKQCIDNQKFSDSIYHSYSAQLQAAKALLISKDVLCNSQANIIEMFDNVIPNFFKNNQSFSQLIYKINKNKPEVNFANEYYKQAIEFVKYVKEIRDRKK